jgi:hypothetical protein
MLLVQVGSFKGTFMQLRLSSLNSRVLWVCNPIVETSHTQHLGAAGGHPDACVGSLKVNACFSREFTQSSAQSNCRDSPTHQTPTRAQTLPKPHGKRCWQKEVCVRARARAGVGDGVA